MQTQSETHLWDIMKSFIKETGLVRQHIDSYNEFIESGLQSIIDEVGEIPIEVEENPFTVELLSLIHI